MTNIGALQFTLLLLLVLVAFFGVLARPLRIPYPIVMVLGGLMLSFVPGVPAIALRPDFIFLVVLPPLLYASAWTTSWRDFRYNLTSILLLAFGLVGFTVIGVSLAAPHVFEGFDWRLGLVLGAIVAPTDAIAASAIARRVGLPQRIVDILEGESLLNDATGLLALEFATSAMVSRQIPALSTGVLHLIWLIAGGLTIGLAIAWVVDRVERLTDDGPVEITLSILVPYAAYLSANAVNASGVLAVVACGLWLSRRSAHFFTAPVRIQIAAVWNSLVFTLNGVVFVLIGLQLPAVRAAISQTNLLMLFLEGVVFSALLISLRLIWTYPGAWAGYWMRTRLLHQNEKPPAIRSIFLVGWTGMRGVVSLAAALALPTTLADGSPFPQRNVILFLTFCVILVTLAGQGLTLPLLVRALGFRGAKGPNCEEQEARRIVTEAALNHIEEARERDEKRAELYDDLALHYRQRLVSLDPKDASDEQRTEHERFADLSLEVLRVERQHLIQLRNEGRINDDLLRRLEREMDLNESRLAHTEW